MRQFINRNPAVVVVGVLVVIGVAIGVMWSQAPDSGAAGRPTQAYYTVDEGKTYFTDEPGKLTPFDKDGKSVARAYLFRCGSDERVVGYVERYTEQGKKLAERYRAEQAANPGVPPRSAAEMSAMGTAAKEVKRPGDAKWTNMREGGMAITRFRCPDGSDAIPVQ